MYSGVPQIAQTLLLKNIGKIAASKAPNQQRGKVIGHKGIIKPNINKPTAINSHQLSVISYQVSLMDLKGDILLTLGRGL